MIVPNSRPQITKEDVISKLKIFDTPANPLSQYPVKILGIRGYYSKSMGNTPENNVNIYDDAICIISDTLFVTFNANTDPSKQYKGIATLELGGPYLYKKGIHGMHHLNMNNPNDAAVYKQLISTGKDVPSHPLTYWAYRQFGNVKVKREGQTNPVEDSPQNRFFIDIHRGGFNNTSSAGCQTIYPGDNQWAEARSKGFAEMDKYNQEIIPYYLIEA